MQKSNTGICDEGYVFLDKTHSVICGMSGLNTKTYTCSKVLSKVANDIYKGILRTEESGFRDKEFNELHKKWKLDCLSYMRKKERHFKEFWKNKEKRSKREKVEEFSDEENKPKRKKTRFVSEEAESSSGEESASESEYAASSGSED